MRLGRSAVGVLGTNLLNVVLSVGNSIFLTRVLGVAGRGEFAIFSASFGVLSLLLGLGLNESIRYFTAQGKIERERILTSLVLYMAVAGLFVFALAHLNHRVFRNELFLPQSKQTVPFELLLAGVVMVNLFYSTVSSVFAGHRSFKVLNGVTLGSAALSLLTYGSLFWANEAGRQGVTTGFVFVTYSLLTVVAAVAVGAMAYHSLGVRFTWKLADTGLLRAMMRYTAVSYFATLAQFMNYRADYWIVQHFCGAASLGLYSLASGLAMMLWIIPRSAATVLGPAMAAGDAGATFEQAARLGRLVFLGSVMLAVLAAVFGAAWIGLLYGTAFAPAAGPFAVLLLGCVPFTLCVVQAAALGAVDRQEANLAAACVGLVVTVILDVLLIPRFGILGAAAASAISYLATTAVVLRAFTRTGSFPVSACVLPERGDLRYVIDGLKNLLR
jgi:O-antigen/teichoic acid export membrane protein